MYSSTILSTSAVDGDGWSTPPPGRFTPWKDTVPIVQEAAWAPGPVWTGAENLALHRDSIPDRSACCQSLSRLSYPDPTSFKYQCMHTLKKAVTPKLVAVNKKLYCTVHQMCICWFYKWEIYFCFKTYLLGNCLAFNDELYIMQLNLLVWPRMPNKM